jgi:polyhydroxyalkanoate synthase
MPDHPLSAAPTGVTVYGPSWLLEMSSARPGPRSGDSLEDLDRALNAAIGRFTFGTSPVATAMQAFDWWAHLAASPGKQILLAEKALRKWARLGAYGVTAALNPAAPRCIEPLPQDRRFDHPGWRRPPYDMIHQGFLLVQQWWHNATTDVRGVSRTDEAAVAFGARQLLDMMSPSNVPVLNPEIAEATFRQGGANLWRGLRFFLDDLRRRASGGRDERADAFQVGRDVAVTPGKVVFRNEMMELIQYAPATPAVRREPVLMQSAWMMKYYIMDLSPHNSLVRYLVERGHTVFMISWRNPGPEHRDWGLDDYRRHGTMTAIDVISTMMPGQKIHGVGYCLGGILLVIAAAAMARDGDDRLAGLTLFTTLTDFSDVGEMAVFMHPSQVSFLEDMMWQKGYLDADQAAGSFQLLKSRDLIWSKMVREYFLGLQEPMFDLMAWNADGTRMPYRQHSELLRRLYLDNDLFQGRFRVDGRPIQIADIRVPIFAVAAEGDHVAPWRSVYKLHLQSDASELTFVLTKGGHNVGIVNEPGRPRRSYRLRALAEGERALDPDTWVAETAVREGSWWPAWVEWLGAHSTGDDAPPPLGDAGKGLPPLADAPGFYVFEK